MILFNLTSILKNDRFIFSVFKFFLVYVPLVVYVSFLGFDFANVLMRVCSCIYPKLVFFNRLYKLYIKIAPAIITTDINTMI